MQLSIFDMLEEVVSPAKQEEKIVIDENPITENKSNIELIDTFALVGEFFEIRIGFWKVDNIDFYNSLFYYFPKLGIRCEYNLASEIEKNNRSLTYYLAFRDLRSYLHLRLVKFGITQNKYEFIAVQEALKWFDDLENKIFGGNYGKIR